MIAKILWSFVLVTTLYVTSIFALPESADRVGDILGIAEFNRVLRELKDGTSEDPEFLPKSLEDLNTGSGLLQQTRDVVGKVQDGVNTTKTVIETKVDQVKKVGASVEKTASAVTELKEDITNLSSFSGTTGSGARNPGKTSSGNSATGSGKTPSSR